MCVSQDNRTICGVKLIGNTDADVVSELNWVDNLEAQWSYVDIPDGKNISGIYGRVEEDLLVSLGFIVV